MRRPFDRYRSKKQRGNLTITRSTQMTVRAKLHMMSLAALIAVGGQAALAKGPDAAEKFAAIDTDSNGQVTADEMRAHAAARFAAVDTDGDGFLSPEEMQATRKARGGEHAKRMLEKFDKDGSGALDVGELEAAFEGRHGHKGKRGKHMMSRMDTNKDGKLALEEMTGKHDPAKLIEKLDKDGDGSLSAEEFAAMRHHGKKHHGHKDQD
jgi:Ca2+-binding EF-hand superfamily protein